MNAPAEKKLPTHRVYHVKGAAALGHFEVTGRRSGGAGPGARFPAGPAPGEVAAGPGHARRDHRPGCRRRAGVPARPVVADAGGRPDVL